MAQLQYRGETHTDPATIGRVLGTFGVPFERWPTRPSSARDDEVLADYDPEVRRLKTERGYVAADVVCLGAETPELPQLLAKFAREHHHTDDEVRYTVEGAAMFAIEGDPGHFLEVTTEPGDLIIIPAGRRHWFTLTPLGRVRCIRLFLTKSGWEAIYEKSA